MTARQIVFLSIAAVLFGLALLAYGFTGLRIFGRFSSDLRYRTDRTPWWAHACTGLGLICIDLAFPLGTWLVGAMMLVVSLGFGWMDNFRVFGNFDKQEREHHPLLFTMHEEPAAISTGEPQYTYAPGPDEVLRNARNTLIYSLCSLGGAYGIYRWAQGLKGETGFGGLIFLLPMLLLGAAGLYMGVMSLVAFARYAMTRRAGDAG